MVEASGASTPDDLAAAWDVFGRVPCVVETLLELDGEISVILARTHHDVAVLPVVENHHVDGILDLSVVPAVCGGRRRRAIDAALAWPTHCATSVCSPSMLRRRGRSVGERTAPGRTTAAT